MMAGPQFKGQGPGLPGWVKGFAWAGGVLVVLLIVMLASGHGPWQHMGMVGMH